jgi:NAD(P)-dependent dehydrogenase (short-subunit alcohol dehydrogenase family)
MMLKHKRALVTGGGRGIGRAIATKFAESGARVAIGSRDYERLKKTAQELEDWGGEVLPLPLDVTKKSEVESTLRTIKARWGGIDIVVNNAGISGMNPLDEDGDSLWYRVIETNLTGMYLVTKAALAVMPDHSHGRIINISSVLGKFGVPGYTAYCTSKHGVIGFTRALAPEVIKRGITVNALCPGWTNTEMAHEGIRQISQRLNISPEEFTKQAMAQVPLGRMVDPMEVANLALYLASEAAQAMTGQALNLCGGATTA